MGSKTLLVLVLLLVPVLLLSAEVAPKNVDGKFDENDGNNFDTNGVDDMKYYGGWGRGGYGGGGGGPGGGWGGPGGGWGGPGGGYGGGWGRGGGGYGGGWGRGGRCPYGCCGWSYYGNFCRRCCYFPGQHVDSQTDAAQPRN